MTNIRERADLFALPGWRAEGGALRFVFSCSRHGDFEETVFFPDAPVPASPDPSLSRLIDLLHVALGVSTYKAGAAQRIDFPALTPGGRRMASRLYTDGLAEFFVRAGLPFPPHTEMRFSGEAPSDDASADDGSRGEALCAFGGGKDSYVARAIAQEAGTTVRLVSVVMADAVAEAIQATAPEPVLFLRRTLDQRLLSLKDGFSGHVPITAINALVLALYGRLTGRGEVIFANERSADEPTMDLGGGVSANHQDSKSSVFEAILARAVREADAAAPVPFSILRPYSELWIGRAFASLGEAHPRFTSCNKNFRLAGDASRRWCGACGKCAFTSLVTAPFLSAQEQERAFGAVLLDAPALLPFYEALLGLTENKPWDCVGTIAECRAALFRVSKQEEMRGRIAVKTFLPRVLEVQDAGALDAAWDEALTPHEAPCVPEGYREAAERLWP